MTKDDNEIPIPVPKDTIVILETDIGTIGSPVKILLGRASARSAEIIRIKRNCNCEGRDRVHEDCET